MNQKQKFYFRLILSVIFILGGCVYFMKGDFVFAGAFLVAGLVFGWKGIKERNKEES